MADAYLHWLHWYNFSPLCFFICLVRWPALNVAYSHWLHLWDFSLGVFPWFHVGSDGEICPFSASWSMLLWKLLFQQPCSRLTIWVGPSSKSAEVKLWSEPEGKKSLQKVKVKKWKWNALEMRLHITEIIWVHAELPIWAKIGRQKFKSYCGKPFIVCELSLDEFRQVDRRVYSGYVQSEY